MLFDIVIDITLHGETSDQNTRSSLPLRGPDFTFATNIGTFTLILELYVHLKYSHVSFSSLVRDSKSLLQLKQPPPVEVKPFIHASNTIHSLLSCPPHWASPFPCSPVSFSPVSQSVSRLLTLMFLLLARKVQSLPLTPGKQKSQAHSDLSSSPVRCVCRISVYLRTTCPQENR